MDFMKVFDETVREIKREVNLKVLKVPEIEQKVLDATDDAPWGPHGSALSDIARATKKFTECQMIMNVLWTRLTEGSSNWRYAYKALTVIEYLIANGSERAVDDILEHSSQISVLSRFEYVEPNGKDVGINVRKKVETIMNLINDKDRIKAVREKAAANRDKYVGLSSSGITFKSSSASYSNYSSSDSYGSFSRDSDSFRDTYRDKEEKDEKEEYYGKKDRKKSSKSESSKKKGTMLNGRNKDSAPKLSTNKTPIADDEDDFDDFDPRGSSKSGTANASSKPEVDLFAPNLMDDLLMDAPPAKPSHQSGAATSADADLFADADFQSAPPQAEPTAASIPQGNVGIFASQTDFTPSFSSDTDLFGSTKPILPSEKKPTIPEPARTESFDPFAAIPLNSFDQSDPFGAFSSHTETNSSVNNNIKNNDTLSEDNFGTFTSANTESKKNSSSDSGKLGAKKGSNFQVKSGIWADSLSRGLIDLNITAPKKVNLADIGIIGGLSDGSEEKDKVNSFPPVYMGRAMGPSTTGGSSNFSSFGQDPFASFK